MMNEELKARCMAVMDELLIQRPGNDRLKKISQKDFLDSADVKTLLQISESTFYRWRKIGLLVPRKIMTKYLYFWIDILPLLEKKKE
jgi:predicted DNA-binding transcriptional regulator AlpA